ncbi:hypothetical protein IPA_04330 [Ignicoccus pacificus DSM 13166]|uniref:CBS domain-containing protein n=1 Tax=Ignicoccus pacificus DSM 13166 TaxID=940294 RepID=A0A977PKW3_9CREN|nr:hypothetical protein IPA_04330 [Ignicoccus pacificus DSM 13166]
MALSIIIGLVAGIVTAVFTDLFVWSDRYRYYLLHRDPWIYVSLAYGLILLVAYTLRRFLGTIHGSSTSYVVKSYHWKLGYVGRKELIIYTLGALASVLAGAVVGPEGPGIALGAFFGYWISRKSGLHGEELRKMTLVGAAAGIASVFRAPLTAMAFAIEVPYKRSLETGVFMPALIATFTSYIVTVAIAGPQRLLLRIKPFKPPMPSADIISSSIGLGITAAALVYLMYFIKHYFGEISEKYGKSKYWFVFPLILATLVVVSALYISEHIPGSGDVLTEEIFNKPEEFTLPVLLIILLGRSSLLPLSLTWGATGGLFMPLVSIGAVLGLFYALLLHVPPAHIYPLMLAGVSAVFSGGQKTLMTSIFIGVEFLGFGAFFSSTIAAATAYLLTLNVSLIAGQLPEVQDPKKRTLMELIDKLMSKRDLKDKLKMKVVEVANKKVTRLLDEMTVKEALVIIEKDLHNNYPVVNRDDVLVGEVSLEVLVTESPDSKLRDLMIYPVFVYEDDEIQKLLSLMLSSNTDRVYVINKERKLVGVVSKTDLLKYALKNIVKSFIYRK